MYYIEEGYIMIYILHFLLQLVDHYHNKSDGLLCKLSSPCACPNFDKKKLQSKYNSVLLQINVMEK